MGKKVSDFVLERLTQWGVTRIYGYPGDAINGLLGALERQQDKFDFIQVRHEEMAAFMACAHAKFTGEVGVCMATSGPGAIHLLNGLYDAKLDHQPVVAIVGQSARYAMGGFYQQEIDLQNLFKDVASEYVQTINDPKQARHVIDRAFRIAHAERTVTCIILPKDVQDLNAIETLPHIHNTIHSGVGYSAPFVIPKQEDLHHAANILNDGKKVAILVGAGALHAGNEVAEVANLLGCGVAKALLGKMALPDTLPFVTGGIGLLGTKPSWDMMMECDTLLMIGSSFPYSEFLPKEGQARGVQIDIDGRMLSLRYPMEAALIGDSKETLRSLIPLLHKKADRSWRKKIETGVRNWWKTLEESAHQGAHPINPELVAWELSSRLPDNAILSADAGTTANWYGRIIQARGNMKGSLSGTLASMGAAVPYAIAAKFAYPERPVVCFTGDGAMQMNGINELITVQKYFERWSNPQFILIVLNNQDLNQVSWEMRIEEGNPRLPLTQSLPDEAYERLAEAIGLRGIRVERPEQLAPALDEAFASSQPVVVNVYTDPNVATLPPHITIEQAKNFAAALVRGDVEEVGVVKQAVKSVMERKR
ncbi:thiamine pyrophosphate-requiring protein [Ktedonobacter racemifer]|uniref:Thiamine pyrophosphate protein TPP binding domain protein n=1 Tax=Ktedonobacter racemifer DSM 44963 TaxID=485913 RepID=D6TWB8_KTERA|nr:thiamine pyrophosphate-requiring protein [Ktedonobacter racemifer]EFH84501.1 thiamine pyrophosphate protein TPP binding domain protein [Ktedonobacter racemifer DSM 44963]